MRIVKMKWGLYAIVNEAGREVGVASSFAEANRMIKKILTNRTNKINNKK